MSVTTALQSALVSHLQQRTSVQGLFFDAPARASFPYVTLNCSNERDWSCGSRRGSEIALQVEIWDEQQSRLLEIEGELDVALPSLVLDGPWHLSSLLLTGKKKVRKPSAPWCCVFELRARLIAKASGATA